MKQSPQTSDWSTRRQVLTAAGVGLAPWQARGAGTRGKIDCQSHLFVPELLDYMEKRQASPYAFRSGQDRYVVIREWRRRILPKHTDVGAKLADMDAAGIELTALSINDPGPELFGQEGPSIARMVNDYIAAVARQHPDRIFGLMVLPLQNMEASIQEMERCANRLGMKGILLYSNLDGRFPDEPEFRPLFAEAEKRGLPILLHPACPVTYDQTAGYNMAAGLGLMFDTSIALCRIILSGILDSYPRLKLVCPHVGGTLPYIVGRVDHQTMVLKRGAEHLTKPPSEYLRRIYLDAVSPLAPAIRYGLDFVGPDRLLYATDHPWVDPKLIAGCIESLKLDPATEGKIFSGNARKLFSL
ncbi:MAG: amidohydrolase family protein [Bryobacteraceae bacterium]